MEEKEELKSQLEESSTLEVATNGYIMTLNETGEKFVFEDRDLYKLKDMLLDGIIEMCTNNGKIDVNISANVVN